MSKEGGKFGIPFRRPRKDESEEVAGEERQTKKACCCSIVKALQRRNRLVPRKPGAKWHMHKTVLNIPRKRSGSHPCMSLESHTGAIALLKESVVSRLQRIVNLAASQPSCIVWERIVRLSSGTMGRVWASE